MSQFQQRESAYQTSPDHLTYLEDCVSATESCVQILQSGIERLYPGVEDLPRLSKVLKNSHRYLVLPTPTITSQKSLLSHTLVPQIENILTQAEQSITTQQAKIIRLESRLKVMEEARDSIGVGVGVGTRVGMFEEEEAEEGEGEAEGEGMAGLDVRGLTLMQRKKVGVLKAKRERLERELKELREGEKARA